MSVHTLCMSVYILKKNKDLKISVVFDSFQHFIMHVNTLKNSTTEICSDDKMGPQKVNLKCWSARVSNLLPTKVFIEEQATSGL